MRFLPDKAATWGQIGGIVGGVVGFIVGLVLTGGTARTSDQLGFIGFIAALGGAIVGVFGVLCGLRRHRRDSTQGEAAATPVVAPEALEQWRVWLRNEAYHRGQEHLASLRHGLEFFDPVVREILARTRLTIQNRPAQMSTIADAWKQAPDRLIILGEPGYGKSVAAISLLTQFNVGTGNGSSPVLFLFRLSEWYRWRTEGSSRSLARWMEDQLVQSYGENGLEGFVAAELIRRGLIVPILDGLDEIPEDFVPECTRAIQEYSGIAAPHRPFIVTCRIREYTALGPDWIPADHQIGLAPLDLGQIRSILGRQAELNPGWIPLRDHALRTDAPADPLLQFFASPLRASLAVQVFRDGEPAALLTSNLAAAKTVLWETLLSSHSETYNGATPTEQRRWLAFLAQGMRGLNRQRFRLHELHEFLPEPTGEIRVLRWAGASWVILGTVGLIHRMGGVPSAFTSDMGLLALFVLLAVLWILGTGITTAPGEISPRGLRARLAEWRSNVPKALTITGIAAGFGAFNTRAAWFGLEASPTRALLAGSLAFYLYSSSSFVTIYRRPYDAGPRGIFGARRPDSGLQSTIRYGFSWLGATLLASVPVMLFMSVLSSLNKGGTMFANLRSLMAPFAASWLIFTGPILSVYLSPFLLHHWLRRRLARAGSLPRNLPAFLDWCAEPRRGWVRVSDAYEFRHRELLEHLAPPGTRY